MIAFNVNDMTCGHCVDAVTMAVKSVESDATVSVNLGTKRVEINAHQANAHALKAAIANAGYTPVEATAAAQPGTAGSGSCCGHRP